MAVDNQTLSLNGAPVDNYTIVREIGRGANGIVFEAVNRLLDRREALKVWLALRDKDARDKVQQGIKEARKASTVAPTHGTIIYHANIMRGVFYATMEYVEGVVLKEALRELSLSMEENDGLIQEDACARVNYARAYIDAIRATSVDGLLHGDAHWSNVILVRDSEFSLKAYATAKLVDFGTSHFTSTESFEARHWRVVEEQLDRMLGCFPGYRSIKESIVFPKNRMHPYKSDYFSELMMYMVQQLNTLE